MLILHFLPAAFIYILAACITPIHCSDYHEQLNLQPLSTSSLLASFSFQSNASLSSFEQTNLKYFPRSLAQILQHTKTRELHLRFTTGRWDAESWGVRPWNGSKEGATGVELWAWIEEESSETAFSRWFSLTQLLSGQFCASLNFIDSTRTTKPVVSFEPTGNHDPSQSLHLLHGVLPGEVVCTENLTPFLKFLPCKGKAGISSLLDGHKLFDAAWQSMAIDIRPVCTGPGEGCLIEIHQTVDMVLDIERSKRNNPIPRPMPLEQLVCDESKSYNSGDACYPLDSTADKAWGLHQVFGRRIKGFCPLEEHESSFPVCLTIPGERPVISVPDSPYKRVPEKSLRCYSLPPGQDDFDLFMPQQQVERPLSLTPEMLYAQRTIVGHGQERGGMRIVLSNPSTTDPVDFVYFETLPWFMRPYLHTLKTSISGVAGEARDIVKETYYRPAVDRHRGTQLELVLSIPPASTVTLTYDFEKAILRYTEYPPDANRGFNVAPAVIRILGEEAVYLRTTSLLLPLPTPDFSMPYNVIILTSTVMALAFGSTYNLLVRRFVAADEVEHFRLRDLRPVLAQKVQKIKEKFGGRKNTKVE